MNRSALKFIPSVNEALDRADPSLPRTLRTLLVRETASQVRQEILTAVRSFSTAEEVRRRFFAVLAEKEREARARRLQRVLNATGIVIHTNLGRAVLPERAVRALGDTAAYCNLEIDLPEGRRRSRLERVEGLLTALTGAEAAMVVNNNAAAVLLALSTLAAGREVVVSRGELVEIGGSFRLPDVMEASGARLIEVGTTNRTYISDYVAAIGPETAVIMRCHPSNFRIQGFTTSPSLAELVEVARKHDLPVVDDVGSGVLVNLRKYGLPYEPTVTDSVEAGAGVVTFSGDKLLGGPQAGIIVGKASLVAKMKKHPLARALRVDKLTLSALEATLEIYLGDADPAAEIPVLGMLSVGADVLEGRAQELARILADVGGAEVTVAPGECLAGGGSLPEVSLPSWTVRVSVPGLGAAELHRALRTSEPPVVGRVADGVLHLDVRTMDPADFPLVKASLVRAVGGRRDA